MEHDIKKFTDWLNTQLNQVIIIQKREHDDVDHVQFNMSQYEIVEAGDASDDYMDSALILKGTGSIMNSTGDFVPLPQESYEIVLTNLTITNFDTDEIELITSRANYNISLK